MNKLRKLIAKPSFNTFKVFNDNLVAVHMYKDTLKLNRPIYVGMSILDLSKHLMYDFYYNQLKQQYSCCNLLYTDTDSLILHVETDDVYKDIKDNQSQYDTSNYNNKHFLFSNENKKSWESLKMNLVEFQLVNTLGLDQRCTLLSQKKKKLEKQKA